MFVVVVVWLFVCLFTPTAIYGAHGALGGSFPPVEQSDLSSLKSICSRTNLSNLL